MRRSTRRAFLATVAGAAATGGLAGCLASQETTPVERTDGAPSTDPPASTDSSPEATRPTTEPSTEPSTEARIRLTAVDERPTDAAVVVYPPALRTWLRRAAERSGPVRGADDAFVYAPEPVLEGVDRVRLVGSEAVEGTYDLSVDGGPRYDLLVGAEPVDEPPANASVISSETLAPARRDLVERAVDEGRRATVVPETPLGEWTRTAFFDGYVQYNGTLYRGYEVQQTDAAFFSTRVWYVLSLSPIESTATPTTETTSETTTSTASSGTASPPLTLRLASVPDGFVDRVDPLLADRTKDQPEALSDPADLPADVERFTRETAYLLTHTALFAVELVR